MRSGYKVLACVALLGAGFVATEVMAQASQVNYGLITAVRQVELNNRSAQNTGAVVGGLAGLATGSGQSNSNRALRTLGGAAVGGMVGGAAGRSTAFEYTVLIGDTNTIRMVTEKAGLRVGDCVSVEQGRFNNIRLASDDRCATRASGSAAVPAAAAQAADACAAATQQLLDAQTDAEFDRAERRMRLLCD